MDAAAQLLTAGAILDGEGLTDAFGHVSARVAPDELLLTPRIGPGMVREAGQLLRLRLDGEVLDGDPSLVPGEAALHLGVLAAREDAGAVARIHGPFAAAWATTGRPLPAITGQAMFLGGPVPVHETAATITDRAGADALAATLGRGTAVLMRGFGQVVLGGSVAEAVVRAVFLERTATAALRAEVAGGALAFEQTAVDAFMGAAGPRAEQVGRLWAYLAARNG